MNARKSFFVVALSGTLAAAAGSSALAQPGPGGEGFAPGWHRGSPLLAGITLTDDQKSKLHAIMHDRQAGRALFEQMHAVHQQIDAALLSSGTVSEASLQPLLRQESQLMQQIEQQRIEKEIAVRNILTSDQLAQAASTHAKLESLHEQEHSLFRAAAEPAAAD